MKMYENIMKSKFQNIRLVDANENPRSPAASGHKYCSADVSRIEPRREARCGTEPMQSAVQTIIELFGGGNKDEAPAGVEAQSSVRFRSG